VCKFENLSIRITFSIMWQCSATLGSIFRHCRP
jgi:hypothetical protein